MNKIKRVVIYGHFQGSHSYIHAGYFKAFEYLGYETHWILDIRELGNIDFEGTLFFTENNAKTNSMSWKESIPIRDDCYYVLHHIDNSEFSECKYINLCNYLHEPLKYNESYNYPIQKGSPHGTRPLHKVDKIKDYVYHDIINKSIYQPWATNLLPNEINDDIIPFDINKKEINFIGSIWSENINQILPMFNELKNRKISLNIYGWMPFNDIPLNFPNINHIMHTGISESDAQNLIESSLIYPDVRGELHKNVGYIPCRLFKNISYGCIPVTNSISSYHFFENLLPYSDNTADYLDISISYLSNRNIERDKYLINKVKNNHTYVNRIQDIMEYFDILYK